MPFNGSGQFVRDNGYNTGEQVWQEDEAGGINIVSDRHDNHDQDIADGLSNCLTKDGQTTPTAALPMGNYRHTGVGAAQIVTDYLRVQEAQNNNIRYDTASSGTADRYEITISPAPTAHAAGQVFGFLAHQTNTGTSVFKINALADTTIKRPDGTDLSAGDIIQNGYYWLQRDTVNGNFILLNPAMRSMAYQNAGSVAITGGTISGLSSALPVASGGSGGNTVATALQGLHAGCMPYVVQFDSDTGIDFDPGSGWSDVSGSNSMVGYMAVTPQDLVLVFVTFTWAITTTDSLSFRIRLNDTVNDLYSAAHPVLGVNPTTGKEFLFWAFSIGGTGTAHIYLQHFMGAGGSGSGSFYGYNMHVLKIGKWT